MLISDYIEEFDNIRPSTKVLKYFYLSFYLHKKHSKGKKMLRIPHIINCYILYTVKLDHNLTHKIETIFFGHVIPPMDHEMS